MSLKQITQYYLIQQEHEDWLTWERLNLNSPIIDYVEQFYIRKVRQGRLTIQEVWEKLLGLDGRFPMSLRRHMLRHIRLEAEQGPSPPPPPPPAPDREQALQELLEDKRKKKVEFDGHAWVRDKRGRIHLINLRTHKFSKIHKRERNKIRKYYFKELGKLAKKEAERQISFAMSKMFKPQKKIPVHERRIRAAMQATFRQPKIREIRKEAERDIQQAMQQMFREPAAVPLKVTKPLRERISQTVKKAVSRISKLLRLPRRVRGGENK